MKNSKTLYIKKFIKNVFIFFYYIKYFINEYLKKKFIYKFYFFILLLIYT